MTAHTYYVVGVHGAPTPETAPHGYMWRYGSPTGSWQPSNNVYTKGYPPHVQWYPLPAPPTEQAPSPEPVARWTARNLGCGWSSLRCGPDLNQPSHEDANAAADALNALDRDGVAWGPGRPMAELPETGRVIVLLTAEHGKGDEFYAYSAEVAHKFIGRVRCWWPLPLPGEATT